MKEWIQNRSLRTKLMMGIGLFSALFTVSVTGIFTVRLYNNALDAQATYLERQAAITAQGVGSGLDFGDKASVNDVFVPLHDVTEFIVVYDVDGNVFTDYFRIEEERDAVLEVVPLYVQELKDYGDPVLSFEDFSMTCVVHPVLNSTGTEVGHLVMGVSTDAIEAEFQSQIVFSAMIFVVALIIGLGAALLFSNFMVRPIQNVVERLRDIAQGEGDLSKRIDYVSEDEIGTLARAFNEFIEKMREMIVQLAQASSQIAGNAARINENTSELAAGSERQANQSTLVAVASEEMSATILQTSSNTNDAVKLSRQAHEAVGRGRHVVTDTVKGMDQIASVVSESATTILALGKTVAQIGRVVEVINDVTDQINLLSLNASIEAASAGEYGKGFAVVAEEVKKLAERTTQSTTEISQMIESIQHATANAIRAMERGTHEVERGKVLGDKTAEALNEILEANNKVMEMITNISVSAQQQSHTAEEISKNIENIATITKETASGVRTIDDATEALVQQTRLLNSLIGRFKLNSNGHNKGEI